MRTCCLRKRAELPPDLVSALEGGYPLTDFGDGAGEIEADGVRVGPNERERRRNYLMVHRVHRRACCSMLLRGCNDDQGSSGCPTNLVLERAPAPLWAEGW